MRYKNPFFGASGSVVVLGSVTVDDASGLLLLVEAIHRRGGELIDGDLGTAAVHRNRLTILGKCIMLAKS